jgi:hypothetical protein
MRGQVSVELGLALVSVGFIVSELQTAYRGVGVDNRVGERLRLRRQL